MIVLDTNIVSALFRGNSAGMSYQQRIGTRRAVISFQTLEEAWYGAYKASWGEKKKTELGVHLEQYEVIYPNEELVEVCARLRSTGRAVGRQIPIADAWIAATAVFLDCPLISSDHIFRFIPEVQLL